MEVYIMFNLIPRTTDSIFPRRWIFDSLFNDDLMLPFFDEEKTWIPAFDVSENEKDYVISAELPGIDVKDLDVNLSDGILTVKGEKKQEKEDQNENYHRVERYYGSFQRSFRIPAEIITDKIDAQYKDGILKLILPKAEVNPPKKIEVKH